MRYATREGTEPGGTELMVGSTSKSPNTGGPRPDLESIGFKRGFVALLDALGTKGVWEGGGAADYAERLQALVTDARSFDPSGDGMRSSVYAPGVRFDAEVRVSALSDTIFLGYSVSEPMPHAVVLFAVHLAFVFQKALERHILLRGAAAFGYMRARGGVFMGPAVDDAAGRYECGDWAGIMAAPTLVSALDGWREAIPRSAVTFTPYMVPIKDKRRRTRSRESGWAFTWPSPQHIDRARLESLFVTGSTDPALLDDIAHKRVHTLEFYDHWVTEFGRIIKEDDERHGRTTERHPW